MPSRTWHDCSAAGWLETPVIQLALIVHSFHVGGLERCAAHLANRLNPKVYQPTIVSLTTSGKKPVHWIDRENVAIHNLHKPPGNDRQFPRKLANLLHELNIDLVHSHNWGTLMETASAVRQLERQGGRTVRMVHAEHGLELDLYRTRGAKKLLRQGLMAWLFRRCDATVAIAECVSSWMTRQCRVPRCRHHLIPNGVERPEAAPADRGQLRQSLGIADTDFVLGSVGRAVPLKGFDRAIDAVAQLNQQYASPVHWILAGDGPEIVRLDERARQLGVADRVHLLGAQSNIGRFLSASDAFLNTSHSEAMNLAILEAMACGKPIIATDVGDNAVLVSSDPSRNDAPCGEVVAPGNVDQICDTVLRWTRDPDLVQQLGKNATRRHAEKYCVDSMVEKYDRLYHQVLNRSTRPNDDHTLLNTGYPE